MILRQGRAVILMLAISTGALAQTAPDTKIDLRLFSKAEAEIGKGCSVALWQSNRDPDKDEYSYAFVEKLDAKSVRQPARMKIGGETLTLRRVATGGKTSGYGLAEYQLYKLAKDDSYAVLDLKLGQIEGEAVDVESGSLTIILPGKLPFRVAVKGGAGCMTAAAAAPPPKAPASQPAAPQPAGSQPAGPPMLRYAVKPATVPRAMLRTAETKYGCQPSVMATGITGYQVSEEAAIWQIPCDRFAYQASAVFALVYVPDPATQHSFLTFTGPKGRKRPTDPQTMLEPQMDVKTRTLTGISLGRAAGDCGVLERYRLVDAEFVLAEYREKEKCDGARVAPEQFPLIFKGK